MANIEIKTIPSSKEDKKVDEKIKKAVEDRNKIIANRFKIDPTDVIVNLHFSRGKLLEAIRHQGDSLGIYCGFLPGTKEIHLIHPNTVDAIFGENLDKEFLIFIDYCLTKLYMNLKYYPKIEDFKVFHKYLTESLAKISSGNFRKEILLFDMKIFNPSSKLNKEKELMLAFYIILEKSGQDYIFEILDELEQNGDIKKFIFEKYKKSLNEIIEEYKKEILEEERKAQIKFRNERKGQRENSNFKRNFNNNSPQNNPSNSPERKFSFRRGYTPRNNNSNTTEKKEKQFTPKINTDLK